MSVVTREALGPMNTVRTIELLSPVRRLPKPCGRVMSGSGGAVWLRGIVVHRDEVRQREVRTFVWGLADTSLAFNEFISESNTPSCNERPHLPHFVAVDTGRKT